MLQYTAKGTQCAAIASAPLSKHEHQQNGDGKVEPKTELELYEMILCGHLRGFAQRLRMLPAERWDWTPDQAAPTPRTLAVHTWQWLQCDRRHIAEPDASKHQPIPDPPTDPAALCDAMDAETSEWERLLRSLTPEQLDRPGKQFNIADSKMNVRGFIGHMIQNSIYKHGQFSELFFALGLDGTEPYTAPFPNPIYTDLFGPKG